MLLRNEHNRDATSNGAGAGGDTAPMSDHASFYWALLPRDARGQLGARERESLLYAFEEHVPVPLESLHAVLVPHGDDRALVCAADRGVVGERCARGESVFAPSDLPGWVDAELVSPRDLNLLHGEFTPKRVAQVRGVSLRMGLVCLTLAGIVVSVAMQDRIRSASSVAADTRNLVQQIKQDAVGLEGLTGPRLDAAFMSATRRASIRTEAQSAETNAVLPDLARVVAALDMVPGLRVEQLTVTDAVTLVATVPADSPIDGLLDALDSVTGFVLGTPSTQPSGDRLRVRMILERAGLPENGRTQ